MAEEQTAVSAGLVVSERDLERRKFFVALEAADIERIRSVRSIVERNVDGYVVTFFRALERAEEAAPLFASPAIVADVKTRKREHLMASVAGEYGIPYAEQRIALAMIYGRAGL